MENGFLDNYLLPDGAAEAIKRNGSNISRIDDGIGFLSGHDRGVAYRFFTHQERNSIKSKISGYPVFDELEMIEWHKDRFDKPVERVRFLPEDLLMFDEDGICVSGRFKESYLRFKAGLGATGMPLARWGVLTDNDIATLTAMNIFTVEQFAAQPRNKIAGRMTPELTEAFEQAIEWVKGKDVRDVSGKQTEQILAVTQENSKLKDEMSVLRDQMTALMSGNQGAKKKAGRPKKEIIVDETEDFEE